MKLPFFLRRPWLVVRGTFVDRDRPNLAALAAVDDPEEFVWAILPHAARSFATSILVLPRRRAWAAAIAYLYCRALDTYEDLHPEVTARPGVLRAFGSRLRTGEPGPAPSIAPDLARDERDRVHLLLIERIDLLDEAYRALPPADRASIGELVDNMAAGMAWATERFSAQDGVLEGDQRARYCHAVIGEPALYAMRSLLQVPVTAERRADALRVAEMIQLANITRDIEKDLARGIAYHPALRSDVAAVRASAGPPATAADGTDGSATTRVRRVREQLLVEALTAIDSYQRLVADLDRAGVSQARGAAVLMLAFTDRYYSGCAVRAGHAGWPGPRRSAAIYAHGILATLSPRWARRVVHRIATQFRTAARRIGGT